MTKKINPGQFQKMTRRYVSLGWWSNRTHAMEYDREERAWSVNCSPLGFPAKGFMVPVNEEQPTIDCGRCLLLGATV